MRIDELEVCCKGSEWIVRDSVKRHREVMKRGFSSLPLIAVCSKCGNMKFIDPGIPDEEFTRRKNARKNRFRSNFAEESQDDDGGDTRKNN